MPQTQKNMASNMSRDTSREDAQSHFTVKEIAKYSLLPGIFPRLQRLAGHFSQFLFMFTQIFGTVGLIPRDHPCLMSENIGRYRFSDILGLAASNVVFDRKHLPQIVMFFAVVLSIVLLAAILLGLAATTMMHIPAAQAQLFGTPTGMAGVPYNTSTDWAMNFLYRIFGETGVIPKPLAGTGLGNPWFTTMLVTMLQYYSLAMLSIAAFMILYILIITVTESARTGEPFSSSFDGVWAPVRLALAIGLLMPVMSSGYNGAQIIALQSAVWGSNLATNVWYGGISKLGNNQKFFSTMAGDPGYRFVRDVFLVNLCVEGLQKLKGSSSWKVDDVVYTQRELEDGHFLKFNFGTSKAPEFCGVVKILQDPQSEKPAGISGTSWPELVASSYVKIYKDFLPIDPSVRPIVYKDETGNTRSVAFKKDVKPSKQMGTMAAYMADKLLGDAAPTAGSKYFSDVALKEYPGSSTVVNWVKKYWEHMGVTSYCTKGPTGGCVGPETRGDFFNTADYTKAIDEYNKWIMASITKDAEHGWTTAGVFYLRLSAVFASVNEVVNNPPVVVTLPTNFSKFYATDDNPSATSEAVEAACSGIWNGILTFFGGSDCEYEMSKRMYFFLRGGNDWFRNSVVGDSAASVLMDGENFSRVLDISSPDSATGQQTSNATGPVFDGLFANLMHIDSAELNPLAVVVQWGNAMILSSVLAYEIGLIASGTAFAKLALSLGSMLLTVGFVLAFWVPTLPFMHFTFAVIEWMISVLEAVIGMPLWTLSLITLKGDGLGDMGTKGVKRLFEIVLRPTIIILSLVGSIIIFTASVSFFNSAFAVYSDAAGATRGFGTAMIAGLGMTFVYGFTIYTLATSCFKLIDHIPDKFGRWMGLDHGFGGDIKVGMSELTNLIVAGAMFKAVDDSAKATEKGIADKRKNDAKNRLKK